MIQAILSRLITGKGMLVVVGIFTAFVGYQQMRIWAKDIKISNRDDSIKELNVEIKDLEADKELLKLANQENLTAYDEVHGALLSCEKTVAANEADAQAKIKEHKERTIEFKKNYEEIKNKLPKTGCGNETDVDPIIIDMVNSLYKDGTG